MRAGGARAAAAAYSEAVIRLGTFEAEGAAVSPLVLCLSNRAQASLGTADYATVLDDCADAMVLLDCFGDGVFDQNAAAAMAAKLAERAKLSRGSRLTGCATRGWLKPAGAVWPPKASWRQ